MPTVLSQPRTAVYRTITEEIVAAIEAGSGQFVMPWHSREAALTRPVNPTTGMFYRGVNVVALWAAAVRAGHRTSYWASYEQCRRIGGQVRRGARGVTIVFYKPIELTEGEKEEQGQHGYAVARSARVFNASQVDGWKPPEEYEPSLDEALDQAESFVLSTRALIRIGSDTACYRRDDDLILMPHKGDFIGTPTSTPLEAYYSTLMHELTHWTGAPWRLNRNFGERFGDEAYAIEELVAELGAAFLCADLEVCNVPRPDHASYIAGWLRVLKNDCRAIFHAAKNAADAASYLGSGLFAPN